VARVTRLRDDHVHAGVFPGFEEEADSRPTDKRCRSNSRIDPSVLRITKQRGREPVEENDFLCTTSLSSRLILESEIIDVFELFPLTDAIATAWHTARPTAVFCRGPPGDR
jgi:hypothetical protein